MISLLGLGIALSLDNLRVGDLRKKMTAIEIKKRDRDEILGRLREESVPSAPLLSRLDLLEDAQIAANETIAIYELEGHGRIRQARPAARFEQTPSEVTRPAPLLGEHSEEILTELGYSAEQLEALKQSRSVVTA